MAKLKFNQKYNTVKICSQDVQFRKWTAADEKNFLKVVTKKGEDLNDLDIYNAIIAPVLKEPVTLTSNEQKKLLIEIRKVTFGSKVKQTVKCPKCGTESIQDLDLNEIENFKCSNFSEIEIIIDEKTGKVVNSIEETDAPSILKITFGRKNINKFKELQYAKQDPVDEIFTTFITFIEKIEYNGNILEINNEEDFGDAAEFFDSLPSDLFEYVINKFAEMSDDIKLSFNFTCPECGHQEEIETENFFEFLWD